MQTVIAIYGGGRLGRMKGEPLWTGLKVKITHGKSRKVNVQSDQTAQKPQTE